MKDLEERYADKKNILYRAFRIMCLQNRYRENFNFTFDRVESAISTVATFDNMLRRIKSYKPKNNTVRREFRDLLQISMQNFVEALENDIDTVVALTSVFDMIVVTNRYIDEGTLSSAEASSVIDILKSWDMVMGVIDWSFLEDTIIPKDITALAQERIEAKKNKDYARSDKIRKEIENA